MRSTRHSTGILATTAVGSLAATPGITSKAFVEELWHTPVPSGEPRYYDGMLYLMSMLHSGGNFRIIGPAGSKSLRAAKACGQQKPAGSKSLRAEHD